MMGKFRMPVESEMRWIVRTLLALLVVFCALQVGFGTTPGETDVAARHAAGKPAPVGHYMAYGFWFGCCFTGLAALALLATSRWWLAGGEPGKISVTRRETDPLRSFWWVLVGVLVLAAVPRLARMRHSFWGDEDWAYRDLIGGRFSVSEEDGSMRFKRHPWEVTLFWDKGTNNQYAYTIAARICHDSWKRISGAAPQAFEEWPLRVPSLVAGLGSILMGALLARRMGYGRAGLWFAVLMAIHPWHLRYSSEARGYTMLIFFLLAGIYFLLAALEDGRWRDWWLFALFEFLALYTWKAAVHPVAALNAGIFVILLVKRRRECSQYWRWLVVNAGVLMFFVPLFAPAIPQIRRKLEVSTQAHGRMELAWFKDVMAELVDGADWVFFHDWNLVFVLAAGVIMAAGLWRMRRDLGWILVMSPVVGAALAFVHFSLTSNELLKWYVFYTLPFLALPVAVGMRQMWYLKYVLLTAYATIALPVCLMRILDPIQPSREAAVVTRNGDEGKLHMGPTDLVTVGLFRASQSYDPRMRQSRRLRSAEALMNVVAECRAQGKKLRVSAANLGYARDHHEHKTFLAVLEDETLFRKTGDFPATESYLSILTYELVH